MIVVRILAPSLRLKLTSQYEMLVDKYTRQASRQPEYELQTFYGQLQHIYVIHFATASNDLGLDNATTIILAAIRACVLDNIDPQLRRLDIRHYSTEGAMHVVDITSVQCLVSRIRDRNKWAIVDRSGSLARGLYIENDDH
jgi:hypothetical protein